MALEDLDVPRGTFFELCRCSTWNIFRQRLPLRPSALLRQREKAWAAPTDSGWLSKARCSKWNNLSVADVPRGTFFRPGLLRVETNSARKLLCPPEDPDVPRGTFLSFADVPRGTFSAQKPGVLRKQRERELLPVAK